MEFLFHCHHQSFAVMKYCKHKIPVMIFAVYCLMCDVFKHTEGLLHGTSPVHSVVVFFFA